LAHESDTATDQDVLDAPPTIVAELIEGSLNVRPRQAFRHARASLALGIESGAPFDQGSGEPGGWWNLDGPAFHLGSDVLILALTGWRREGMPVLPAIPHSDPTPDWICELLNPAIRQIDLTDKRRRRAAASVAHFWLADPIDHTVEALTLRDGAWAPVAALKDDEEVRVPPFDAVAFSVAVLWPD
jgi:hypothetical protein